MSIYKGNSLIAGGSQVLPLLTFIWSDCIKNHPSWLRADTFSWQSGSVYQAVYQHLADDITGKTLQSETISGTTIQFYLADDGHKICPVTEETNATAIYNATGAAWYYIIDTTNQRFKLPRVSPVKEMLVASTSAPVVTNGVQPIFTDGSKNGSLRQAMKNLSGYTHYMYADGVSVGEWGSTALKFGSQTGLKVDLSQTTSTSYFKGNKYLYFYVGNFTQTALENTAGVVTEDFNELNAHKVIAFQEPTAANNYTWYRKYADGWVEQGGIGSGTAGSSGFRTINFPIVMSNTNYTATGIVYNNENNGVIFHIKFGNMTTTKMEVMTGYSGKQWGYAYGWQVSGMAA